MWRAILATLILALTACQSAYTPESQFLCPYPRSETMQATEYSSGVEILPLAGILRECNARKGCVKGGTIYINGDMTGQGQYDTYMHEICHLYEMHVLGLSGEDTLNHKGWIINF